MRKIIARGAEAILYKEKLDGQEALVKERIKKSYRLPQIDSELRLQRTRREARLLSEARRRGAATPKVFSVDEKSCKIIMEFIKGKMLKELFNEAPEKDAADIAKKTGGQIALLHSGGIIHGDLTTSNMILSEGKIYFFDFGLGEFSRRIEDFATDLSVLKEAIKSTHFRRMDILWRGIEKGYKSANPNAEAVFRRMAEIEKRGRYSKRD
ncbi:MAG: Kae1-associated serine/threonine protein kinase [Nanoarchaeota archaeon]|nr:Kae1-associated serine/threonine protein kinase [Nanoarchaeota archaeon]